MPIEIIAIIVSLLSLGYAGLLIRNVLNQNSGTASMMEIASAIREGANAYLHRQYKTIAVFAIVIFALLGILLPQGEYKGSILIAIGFLVGAIFSGLAGYIGMATAVRANVRTAHAAKLGLAEALSVAFKGGSVTGLSVVGLALLGVSGFYYIFKTKLGIPVSEVPNLLIGFGFGASLISLFARVGGGIFTKAADVGADLVGKIEKNIPEDDPRNPAVIADNVGDNVGDCAGMGADLFETYAVTLIAAMILAAGTLTEKTATAGIELPLLLGAIAIVASIIGTFFVKLGKKKNIMHALYKGMATATIISAIGFYFAIDFLIADIRIFLAALVGLLLTIAINVITEFYTSTKYSPVKKIAKASETGAGTNVIIGLAVGLQSTMLPVLAIMTAIGLAYYFGETSYLENGIYG
ncbi:sodium/proton-translocating pyrophosphatase, partial [Candidatus Peregrinibacteria bacterium]|nr:sodium/proton-translocating pyrophosphatase [Candidatus Peregrinibacteria bacterium]